MNDVFVSTYNEDWDHNIVVAYARAQRTARKLNILSG